MAAELNARFTKRFPGGAEIRGELCLPARGHAVTVLFGPSGSGKSTVLRCLAGLETPEEGTIRWKGETWFDAARRIQWSPQRRGVGCVFQDYALFPHLSVRENVGHGLRGVDANERRERVDAMLERLQLGDVAARRPRELSGGQQQRVALARTLVCRPRLLLLDEPLAALDAPLRDRLRGELQALLKECAMPVVLVTHDRDEALALGEQVVVMAGGAVRQSGRVLEVFLRPRDAEVARIVRIENLQPGRVVEETEGLATVSVDGVHLVGVAPPAGEREVIVCIRGEDIVLQPGDAVTATSVRNRLPARVVALQPGSPLWRVDLDAGFPLFAFVTRAACAELDLQPGREVRALIKTPAVHLVGR